MVTARTEVPSCLRQFRWGKLRFVDIEYSDAADIVAMRGMLVQLEKQVDYC